MFCSFDQLFLFFSCVSRSKMKVFYVADKVRTKRLSIGRLFHASP